jgi:hypothetical protein
VGRGVERRCGVKGGVEGKKAPTGPRFGADRLGIRGMTARKVINRQIPHEGRERR